jgi:hypothetical protein
MGRYGRTIDGRSACPEHQLQTQLTARWIDSGVQIGSESFTLVAWEVMLPSWRVNDAQPGFGQPAIDFLGVDGDGGLMAIELKMRIGGLKATLRAACQVSHTAALIDQTKSRQNVEQAHLGCFSGNHGRTPARTTDLPLLEITAHARLRSRTAVIRSCRSSPRSLQQPVLASQRGTPRGTVSAHDKLGEPGVPPLRVDA